MSLPKKKETFMNQRQETTTGIDYSKWDAWAKELEEDEEDRESSMQKQFSQEMARMAYESLQGKPISSEEPAFSSDDPREEVKQDA